MDNAVATMGPHIEGPADFAMMVLAAVFGLQFLLGNLAAALIPERMGRVAKLASHHRLAGAGLSIPALLVLLSLALLARFVPDLLFYLLGFLVLGLCCGLTAGCFCAGAAVSRKDPSARPFLVFYAGFGLQAALLCVPVVKKFVLLWFAAWGLGAIALLLLGFKLPEDAAP